MSVKPISFYEDFSTPMVKQKVNSIIVKEHDGIKLLKKRSKDKNKTNNN